MRVCMLSSNFFGMSRKNSQSEETRATILNAAIEVFFHEGVTHATLEKIAVRANVTRGAIYWHFKNKKDIFEALHDDLYKTMMQIVFENMSEGSLLENLERSCIECLLSLAKDEKKKRTLTIFFCKCDYSQMEDILLVQRQKKLENIEYFASLFHKVEAEIKSNLEPYSVALSLSCYMSGIVNEYLRNNLFDLQTEAEKFIRQFFLSIKK